MYELPMRSMKSLRIDKSFNQEDMAEKLKINRATYSNYENFNTCPDVLMAFKIADVLEYPVDRIIWQAY